MTLNLGIRLVILLPTFLFFVGFSLKSFIEKKGIKKIEEIVCAKKDISLFDYSFIQDRFYDFCILLALDSIFILIANGLIIVFELEQSEFGILAIIFGVIFSIYLMVSIYAGNISIKAIFGIFGVLGGEFFYFLFYDADILVSNIHSVTFLTIGASVGMVVGGKVIINTFTDSAKSIEYYIKEKCKDCEKYEHCKVIENYEKTNKSKENRSRQLLIKIQEFIKNKSQ